MNINKAAPTYLRRLRDRRRSRWRWGFLIVDPRNAGVHVKNVSKYNIHWRRIDHACAGLERLRHCLLSVQLLHLATCRLALLVLLVGCSSTQPLVRRLLGAQLGEDSSSATAFLELSSPSCAPSRRRSIPCERGAPASPSTMKRPGPRPPCRRLRAAHRSSARGTQAPHRRRPSSAALR